MDELHQCDSDVIVEDEVSVEIEELKVWVMGAHTPSLEGSWDVIPLDMEDKMDADSGYDPNPPSDSNLDEDWENELLREPEVVMPGVHSDDSVTLTVTPGDMDTL